MRQGFSVQTAGPLNLISAKNEQTSQNAKQISQNVSSKAQVSIFLFHRKIMF